MNKIVEINREDFIKICNESNSKIEAYHKLKMHRNTFQKYCNLFGIQKFRSKKEKNKYDLQDILNGKYPQYNASHLNKRLINEGIKEAKCECCGNTEWLGHPIILELHHIDGDHSNHKLENLQLLCPNCHSLTDTFKSKKLTHYKFK